MKKTKRSTTRKPEKRKTKNKITSQSTSNYNIELSLPLRESRMLLKLIWTIGLDTFTNLGDKSVSADEYEEFVLTLGDFLETELSDSGLEL